MGGLAFIKFNNDGTLKSSFDKFFNEEQLKNLAVYCNANPGDLILIAAGKEERTQESHQRPAFIYGRKIRFTQA